VHEALFYSSDEELLNVIVPFLVQGLEAAEPTLVVINDRAARLLRQEVGSSELVFLDGRHHRHNPASRIVHHREIITGHVANGAQHVRVVGEVPHPGHGSPWGWWARYEATINHAYAELPLWNVCPYDLRITPAPVVEDVTRTHPWLAADDGSPATNPHYEDPRKFLLRQPAPDIDPLEAASAPQIDLVDPTPAEARRAARACGRLLPVDAFDLDDVVMCVNEAVTNALVHGRAPVRLRVWATPERIVVSVADQGEGPGDPFVGLLPAQRRPPDRPDSVCGSRTRCAATSPSTALMADSPFGWCSTPGRGDRDGHRRHRARDPVRPSSPGASPVTGRPDRRDGRLLVPGYRGSGAQDGHPRRCAPCGCRGGEGDDAGPRGSAPVRGSGAPGAAGAG
jgi:MEDS: MEthanogen/methylotroph, DcmR Sensory domain/Histidine kinase-like ATPase domain